MDAFFYLSYMLLYVILFVWSFSVFRESSFWGTSWVLFIVVTMIYDNTILAAGGWLGMGSGLEMFNLFRYLLHVLLLPTLVFVALDILRRVGVEWSEHLSTFVAFNLYTFALTVGGIVTEVIWGGPFSSTQVTPNIPVEMRLSYIYLLALIPLLIAGIEVWRRLRWPILLFGVGVAIVGAVLSIVATSMITSALQLVLMWSLVMMELRLKHEDFTHTW